MGQQSKRTRAPAPREAPPPAPLLVSPPAYLPVSPPAHLLVPPAPKSAPPPAHLVVPPALKPAPSTHHPVIPSAIPSSQRTSTWVPPRPHQSVAASLQQPGESRPTAQGPCWAQPACIGDATSPWYMADSMDYSDPQAWGVDSHPPGGYLSYFQNIPGPTQPMHNGSSSQPVNVGDDTNGGDCGRTEKRLLWTKQEDLRLVGAWLNNSNDPIQSNYKKNAQYWKDVAAVYNSTTPKNRERLVKQVKDRFARIKKRVAWFCASYKEANALYVSGESDADLKRAIETYEEDQKKMARLCLSIAGRFLRRNQNGTHIWNA